MALLPNVRNGVVLGAPFFTAFVGMFDTENERIGFANSMRAMSGTSIACIGETCDTDHTGGSDGQEEPHDSTVMTTAMVFLCGAVLVLCIVICASVCIFKRRTEREIDDRRVERRKQRGAKGYSISDEKEDDSDEEEI